MSTDPNTPKEEALEDDEISPEDLESVHGGVATDLSQPVVTDNKHPAGRYRDV